MAIKDYLTAEKWKKIGSNQMKFLYHTDKHTQEELICGMTGFRWLQILGCLMVYYIGLLIFWFACFSLFMSIIVGPSGSVPYRKGFIFANEKIDATKYAVSFMLASQAQKELDAKEIKSYYTYSHLDFPMLSLLPKRSETDDDIEGTVRNANYASKLQSFWEAELKANNNSLNERLEPLNVLPCRLNNYYNDRIHPNNQVLTLFETACKIDDSVLTGITKACDTNPTTDVLDWSYDMSAHSQSVANFKPCFIAKLNRIVGVVPIPWKDNLDQIFLRTMTKNETKVMTFPDLPTVKQVAATGQLPLACWVNVQPGHEQSKPFAGNLSHFLGTDPNKPFINFIPGPWIDIKQYPYMGQQNSPMIPTVIQLQFNDNILPQDLVTIDCRVFARNIPYEFTLDATPAMHFGHARVRVKYYRDASANQNFFKLEK